MFKHPLPIVGALGLAVGGNLVVDTGKGLVQMENGKLICQHKYGNFFVLQFGDSLSERSGVFVQGDVIGDLGYGVHQDFAAQTVGDEDNVFVGQSVDFLFKRHIADFCLVIGNVIPVCIYHPANCLFSGVYNQVVLVGNIYQRIGQSIVEKHFHGIVERYAKFGILFTGVKRKDFFVGSGDFRPGKLVKEHIFASVVILPKGNTQVAYGGMIVGRV